MKISESRKNTNGISNHTQFTNGITPINNSGVNGLSFSSKGNGSGSNEHSANGKSNGNHYYTRRSLKEKNEKKEDSIKRKRDDQDN